jgi:3-oxoacyl-[acyl-carrier protein] reductase
VALSLAGDGWSVAFCYRTSADAARETAEAVRAKGARVLEGAYDVSDPQACQAFVSRVLGEWGRVDALINSAGPYQRVPLLDESLEGWHEMFDNNLDPVFYMSRLVAPAMIRQRWGRIVSFGMANADQMVGQPNLTAHYIAKVGVLVLTRVRFRTPRPPWPSCSPRRPVT